jgi:hypothetical protein
MFLADADRATTFENGQGFCSVIRPCLVNSNWAWGLCSLLAEAAHPDYITHKIEICSVLRQWTSSCTLVNKETAVQDDGRATHVTADGQVTTCVLPVGSRHGRIRGPFLSCSAVLVARTSVMCTVFVAARAVAVADCSEKSQHLQIWIPYFSVVLSSPVACLNRFLLIINFSPVCLPKEFLRIPV